MFMVYPLNLNQ